MADAEYQSAGARFLPGTPVRAGSLRTSGRAWSLYSVSISSLDSPNTPDFWQTPPKFHAWKPKGLSLWKEKIKLLRFWKWVPTKRVGIYVAAITIIIVVLVRTYLPQLLSSKQVLRNDGFDPPMPTFSTPSPKLIDPVRWLRENSDDRYSVSTSGFPQLGQMAIGGRPRAAIISLVRNTELQGMLQSMRQLEYRWNRKYKYPWIFFNDEPFSEEFKAATRNSTTSECYFETVPKEHWSLPEWIDRSRFENSLEYLGTIGVGKGWMESYHHMCRWNSGFFYKHHSLKEVDWYWRVEPDVHFYCDIDYDVFRFMRDNNMKYGFNMNILDDTRSFPSLWTRTRDFITSNPDLMHPEADLNWLIDTRTGEYNNCQFFSNFEIGSLNFWRGKENEAYFRHLDHAGGFYYERFGDAPVHTLSVAMFVPKSEVWFFRDIGYQHDINRQCPANLEQKCACQPTRLDENFYKLVPSRSPQVKPQDTCIRQWLGGEWMRKKEGWSVEGEKAFGGDGYHGYVKE